MADKKVLTTTLQYDALAEKALETFSKKTSDYGTSWRVMRLKSLTDQIFIKAQRIKTIQEKRVQQVKDPLVDEFIGMINYCIMALIQTELKDDKRIDIPVNEAIELYKKHMSDTKQLMLAKNHDYGEAWRSMRISSFVDLILMKLLRLKQIEDNNGATLMSEGVDAGYRDIINYSYFALIRIGEGADPFN